MGVAIVCRGVENDDFAAACEIHRVRDLLEGGGVLVRENGVDMLATRETVEFGTRAGRAVFVYLFGLREQVHLKDRFLKIEMKIGATVCKKNGSPLSYCLD